MYKIKLIKRKKWSLKLLIINMTKKLLIYLKKGIGFDNIDLDPKKNIQNSLKRFNISQKSFLNLFSYNSLFSQIFLSIRTFLLKK